MRELSLNILDITENSFKAKASLVEVFVIAENGIISITVKDNGCGMDKEFLARVTDPYTTTRTTRKVGMGIPLIKMEAEMSGGSFSIDSEKGVGTVVTTTFQIDHIDRPPLGDIADTIVSIVADLKDAEFVFYYKAFGSEFTLDTREVKKELDGLPLSTPEVLIFLRDMIKENIITKNGGVSL